MRKLTQQQARASWGKMFHKYTADKTKMNKSIGSCKRLVKGVGTTELRLGKNTLIGK